MAQYFFKKTSILQSQAHLFLGLFAPVFLVCVLAQIPSAQANVYGFMKSDFNAQGILLKAGHFVYLKYDGGRDWILGNSFKTHVPKSNVEVITTYKYDPALNGKVKKRFLIYMAVPSAINEQTLYSLDRTVFAPVGMDVKILERQGADYIISYQNTAPGAQTATSLGRLPVSAVDVVAGQAIKQTEEIIPPDPDPD